jgi:hypothetical protein
VRNHLEIDIATFEAVKGQSRSETAGEREAGRARIDALRDQEAFKKSVPRAEPKDWTPAA